MATRKLLFVNVDSAGFVFDDTVLSASDVVDVQGAQISNVKDPLVAQDAATKAFVDAQILAVEALVAASEDFSAVADTGGVTAFQAMRWNTADHVLAGDSSDVAKVGIIGLAIAAAAYDAPVTIRKEGVLAGCLTGATAGTPYYLGHTGLPVLAAALVGNDRVIRLGFAKNATDLWIGIEDINAKKA